MAISSSSRLPVLLSVLALGVALGGALSSGDGADLGIVTDSLVGTAQAQSISPPGACYTAWGTAACSRGYRPVVNGQIMVLFDSTNDAITGPMCVSRTAVTEVTVGDYFTMQDVSADGSQGNWYSPTEGTYDNWSCTVCCG